MEKIIQIIPATEGLWATEYSIDQGFFHVGPLEDAIKINRHGITQGLHRDYLIICIGTAEECFEFANAWRKEGNCPNLSSLYDYEVC